MPISAPEIAFYPILTPISSHVYRHSILSPAGVRIRDAILVFNVLLSEEHLEPNRHFAFLNLP